MIMHKALHPGEDIDRLYTSRKEVGRGRTSIEDSVYIPIRRLEDYIKKRAKKDFYSDSKQPNRTITRK